jgi:hypothetical protein
MRRSLDLTWSAYEGRECLCVRGWSAVEIRELRTLPVAELSRRFAVLPSKVAEASRNLRGLQPVAGRFEVTDDAVVFLPRFPFVDGTAYTLIVTLNEGDDGVWTIERPARVAEPATRVVAVYPSSDAVPVNLLKLYIHFSGPMSEGWALRAVLVRRADNAQPLEGVFLPMEPELWDRERRRLTLLLDPGRIKRGLAPHEEAGYPLTEGVPIVVSVDTAFRDAAGRPLLRGAEQCYQVGPPMRARVDPAVWRLHGAAAGTMDPLVVEFDRPLDHALLAHSLSVADAAGALVPGRGSSVSGEQCWRFEPYTAWESGRYRLVVEPSLEDLAGNSCLRVFDRDLLRAEDTPGRIGQITLEFTGAHPDRQPQAR